MGWLFFKKVEKPVEVLAVEEFNKKFGELLAKDNYISVRDYSFLVEQFLETNNANFKINKYYYLENNIHNAIEIKSHMVYNRKKAEHATVFLRTLLFSLGIFFWWPHRREHGARIYLCSELFLRLNINWD